jgi:SWI/SNF-related matrix-associated actin-dependent regulator 1 of chromatin subfamily A
LNEPLSFENDIDIDYYEEPREPNYPPYLADIPPNALTHGSLSYNRRQKCFVIKGSPEVCRMAKLLFPGCEGRTRDTARFAASRRVVGNLNWLMLRYPLEIAQRDRELWFSWLDKTRSWAIRRQEASLHPIAVSPDESVFSGELRPFQQEGVGFLLQNERALLADEMGLGKTVQALAFLAHEKLFPAIVVVPPHLIRNWQREIRRFLVIDGREPVIHEIKGLKPYPLPQADIYIVHYLLLRKWKQELPKYGFACAVFDEIQELRHSGTEKYSGASLLSESCKNAIGLSGTPIYNRGGEIWNVINILEFQALGSWESFSRQWCHGYGNNIVSKPELLGEHLRNEGLILRRTKEEVLPQLPPKRRLVHEVDFSSSIYESGMKGVKLLLTKLSEETNDSQRALLIDQISRMDRQATGLAKAEYVCAYVSTLVQGGEKVLLFAHHHAVMDAYRKYLKPLRPVFVTGRETGAQKDKAVESFMGGKTDICCISLRAASGLNLQRASCVVFGELDWSPAVHSQAEDRAHRMGQDDSVLCYYLVAAEGSDRNVQDALGLKVSQFTGLMGDRQKAEDEILQSAKQAKDYFDEIAERLSAL